MLRAHSHLRALRHASSQCRSHAAAVPTVLPRPPHTRIRSAASASASASVKQSRGVATLALVRTARYRCRLAHGARAIMPAEGRRSHGGSPAFDKFVFNPRGYRVAVFGRSSVGKNILFDRLTGGDIVDISSAQMQSTAAPSRDGREADVSIGDLEFRLIDTPDLEVMKNFLVKDDPDCHPATNEPMDADLLQAEQHILRQAQSAIEECDVAIFVLGPDEKVTPLDRLCARWLRRHHRTTRRVVDADGNVTHVQSVKPVVVIANNRDQRRRRQRRTHYLRMDIGDRLGFGEPVIFSASNPVGVSQLHHALYDAFFSLHDAKAASYPTRERDATGAIVSLDNVNELRLALVGRSTVGKSTIISSLLSKTQVSNGSQPPPGATPTQARTQPTLLPRGDTTEIEWRNEEEEKEEHEERLRGIEWAEEMEEDKREWNHRDQQKFEWEDLQKAGFIDAAATYSEPTDSRDLIVPTYRFALIDTAGLDGMTAHSQSRLHHSDETRVDAEDPSLTDSTIASLRSIARADVVALVVDITGAGIEGIPTMQQMQEREARRRRGEAEQTSDRVTDTTNSIAEVAASDTSSDESSVPMSVEYLNAREAFHSNRYSPTLAQRMHLRTFVRNVFSPDDLAILDQIAHAGRAPIILINKFDFVPSKEMRDVIRAGVDAELRHRFDLPKNHSIAFCGTVSGLRSQGDDESEESIGSTIRRLAINSFDQWSVRIPTDRLNRWLTEALLFLPPPPPLHHGDCDAAAGTRGTPQPTEDRLKLTFIQQVATRPPTFEIFSNRPDNDMPEEYRRLLISDLREEFKLSGVGVRLHLRVGQQPFSVEKSEEEEGEERRSLARSLRVLSRIHIHEESSW